MSFNADILVGAAITGLFTTLLALAGWWFGGVSKKTGGLDVLEYRITQLETQAEKDLNGIGRKLDASVTELKALIKESETRLRGELGRKELARVIQGARDEPSAL